MKEPNPRAAGFNYGLGWGSSPKPAVYYEGDALANMLRKQLAVASKKAWALDHALWRVRIAETDKEKAQAIAELTAEVRQHKVREAVPG